MQPAGTQGSWENFIINSGVDPTFIPIHQDDGEIEAIT